MRTIGYSSYNFRPIGTYSSSKVSYIGSQNNKPVVKSSTH